MERKVDATVPAGLIGLCVALSAAAARADRAQGPVVVAALEKQVVTQHEPVILVFELTNPSAGEADLDLGFGFKNVEVKLTDPAGRTWPKPPLFPPKENEALVFMEGIRAAPRTTGDAYLLLDEWFNFEKVGRYRIEVAVSPSSASASRGLRLPDTVLNLSVLPRQEAALRAACGTLAVRVRESKSYERAEIAAKALAKVEDPAAVPYLAEALSVKPFASIMISALARLNTPDAINALVAASQSSDPETSSLARATLAALKREKPTR
jgi:hypothetical protein